MNTIILLFAIQFFRSVIAPPTRTRRARTVSKDRTLVDLNIADAQPAKIELIPSDRFPGGTNYRAEKRSKHRYIIGDVADGHEIIVPGDPNIVSRYVLLVKREDMTKYMRVLTKRKDIYGFAGEVQEFVKGPYDPHYIKLSRDFINLDLLSREYNQCINVELVMDWSKYDTDVANGTIEEGTPKNLGTLPMKYSIKHWAKDYLSIGRVSFGAFVLEDAISRLTSREVTWEGGMEKPRITVVSRSSDGTEEITIHALQKNKFIIEHNSRRVRELL
ncbi:signal peptide containing protein [Theileria equi strain WA]|uniref:Signal peptide containing protein n=1 Tax=Theileria equi strain WA TaxID=1537102 RepID=L1L9V8_THEEQ|nr:signal peptide containing protein [Theileria equi strain WA]EKX72039.1 signal peptide containing protein [Theileria equi strain WA]|eukprot:XP_004831491.1 signal peptide containing protein [Theileria equi strain WA]